MSMYWSLPLAISTKSVLRKLKCLCLCLRHCHVQSIEFSVRYLVDSNFNVFLAVYIALKTSTMSNTMPPSHWEGEVSQ